MRQLPDTDQNLLGPGTDLVFSLSAVLILVVVFQAAIFRTRGLDLQQVTEYQERVMLRLAEAFAARLNPKGNGEYRIAVDRRKKHGITIQNEATLQRFRFGGQILFEPKSAVLKKEAERVLDNFTMAIRPDLPAIQEIRIQGHADWQQIWNGPFKSNLHLAAERSIVVFRKLQDLKIEPLRHIMSAASFGEFVPVARHYEDADYSWAKWKKDNDSDEKLEMNRRIEIELRYRCASCR